MNSTIISAVLTEIANQYKVGYLKVSDIYFNKADKSIDKTIEIISKPRWQIERDYTTHHTSIATLTQHSVQKVRLCKDNYSYIEVCISEKTTPNYKSIATLTAQRIATMLNGLQ